MWLTSPFPNSGSPLRFTRSFHPEEQRAGDGADGQHQQDDGKADCEQDLHHARGYGLGFRRELTLGVAALHFLFRRPDLEGGGGQRLIIGGAALNCAVRLDCPS
jgi:hypothetical protein